MTTAESEQVRSSSSTPCNRLPQKGMAVACFLFPLLYLVSAICFIIDTREFIGAPVYQWVSIHDVEQYRFSQWACMAMISATIGMSRLLGDSKLRRAPAHEIADIPGIGQQNASRIKAVIELGLSLTLNTEEDRPTIHSPAEKRGMLPR